MSKGFCSVCGGLYTVRKDGKLRIHSVFVGFALRVNGKEECTGWDKPFRPYAVSGS